MISPAVAAIIAAIVGLVAAILGINFERRRRARESGENRVPICPLCQKDYVIVEGKPEADCECELLPGMPNFYRQDLHHPAPRFGYDRWLFCAECTENDSEPLVVMGSIFRSDDVKEISAHIEQHMRVQEIRTYGTPLSLLKEDLPSIYRETRRTFWGWNGAFLFANENPWQVRLADAQVLDQGENTLLVQHLEELAQEVGRKIEQLEQDLELPNSPVGSLAIQRELTRLQELLPIFETVLPQKETAEAAQPTT